MNSKLKTVLIPALIALSFYIVLFLILRPLYRRYRSHLARYSHYTPLSSSLAQQTTSLFEPYLIEPSKTLLQKLKDAFVKAVRWAVVPSAWALERRMVGGSAGDSHGRENRRESEDDEDDHGGLFDVESGEAMIGFDVRQGDLGRDGTRGRDRNTNRAGERQINRDNQGPDADDSNRRLSRELEQGFRDDSGSELSDEEVTAGRRTVSRRGSELRR